MGKGPENFTEKARVKAANIDTNDIGFKDLDAGFDDVGQGINRNEKILEQLDELKKGIEEDEARENQDNSDLSVEKNENNPLDKINPEQAAKIPALAFEKKDSKERQISLETLLTEVVKGLNLPEGRMRDLANEVLAIAGSNLTQSQLEERYSLEALKIYKETAAYATDFSSEEFAERVKQAVIKKQNE